MKIGRFETVILAAMAVGIAVMLIVLVTVPVTRATPFETGEGAIGNVPSCQSAELSPGSTQEFSGGAAVSFRWATNSTSVIAHVEITDPSGAMIHNETGPDGFGNFTTRAGTYALDLNVCESGMVFLWGNVTTVQPIL